MLSLCYVSAGTARLPEDKLIELLSQCRQNNALAKITGLLLYNGKGTFLQVLQGEDHAVTTLFEKIKQDERHHRVHCIGKKPIEKSDFPNWRMGFRPLDTSSVRSLDGFSDFMNADDDLSFLSDHTDFTYSILSHFKSSTEPEHASLSHGL